MKSFVTSVLITLLISLVPTKTYAEYDAKIEGIYYRFSGSEAKVTYWEYNSKANKDAYWGDIVIPETVTYEGKRYIVTRIDDYAFYNCSEMTSIVIGNNVKVIGTSAFQYCLGLTSVTIPNSVTSIGYRAFHECI